MEHQKIGFPDVEIWIIQLYSNNGFLSFHREVITFRELDRNYYYKETKKLHLIWFSNLLLILNFGNNLLSSNPVFCGFLHFPRSFTAHMEFSPFNKGHYNSHSWSIIDALRLLDQFVWQLLKLYLWRKCFKLYLHLYLDKTF